MDMVKLKTIEIMNNITLVPAEKLAEIDHFIQLILLNDPALKRRPISVRGIWKNKGFEDLDIEKELKEIRTEAQLRLDQKVLF